MLELKNIKKIYKTSNFKQIALDNISLSFRNKEFVSILGESGSGKTTLLNIIGQLDTNYFGDVVINGKKVKNFKRKSFDFYRNGIGFIFQNYNLINHISVYKNVELKLVLSKVPYKKRKQKVYDILKKVGLLDCANKMPSELSGGQRQRVAVARALVTNPSIILADEPTGALDSKTSIKVMDLIKNLSKDKLVIMVTHNESLARKYSNRIIKLKDGIVTYDSNTFASDNNTDKFLLKKTKINFLSLLYLSLNNIKTKKQRFFLTSIASSIGIIGIALILAISNGFNKNLKEYEKNVLNNYPITISKTVFLDSYNQKKKTKKDNYLYRYNDNNYHENKITPNFISYINKINNKYISALSYNTNTKFNLIIKENSYYKDISNLSSYFIGLPYKGNKTKFLNDNYTLLKGRYPVNKNEIVLITNNNDIEKEVLESLNLNREKVSYDEVLNKEFKIIDNNDFYKKINDNIYVNNDITDDIYYKNSNINLKIVGIVKEKATNEYNTLSSCKIGYLSELLYDVINKNKESFIVEDETNKDRIVFIENISYNDFKSKDDLISYLGGKYNPNLISIYPKNFNSKKKIISYINKYNYKKTSKDKIIYTDLAKKISDVSNNTIRIITIVLILFSSVSLVVSSVMIGIITYISVLERTKEIGILKSLGARKKDITRLFSNEVLIIGFASGLFGVLFTKFLLVFINAILYKLTDVKKLGILKIDHIVILIMLSVFVTMIGGIVPSYNASKKNIIESLKDK